MMARFGWCMTGQHITCPGRVSRFEQGRAVHLDCDCACHDKPAQPTKET